MLRAADVWFGYDERTPVLRGVSVAVPAAGIVGILGPNGSGKTTLLRLLAGTRQPQRGAVSLDDAPLSRFSRTALARRMAIVPQETQLAFDYTVAEVAMMGRYPHLGPFEIEGPADIAVIEETLASTGTLALKDRSYATLSGGEKQRVVIAAALAQIFRDAAKTDSGSGYLLLDEPTASLDLAYQLEIAELLRQLHRDRGVAVVISTHDLGLAGTICDHLLLIRDGVVVADGATDDVLTPENVRRVYGVEADVIRHASGHLMVVPVRRTDRGAGGPRGERDERSGASDEARAQRSEWSGAGGPRD
jgi:iron complex transport system ATP-binding protein